MVVTEHNESINRARFGGIIGIHDRRKGLSLPESGDSMRDQVWWVVPCHIARAPLDVRTDEQHS
jgi:hypothetical protein